MSQNRPNAVPAEFHCFASRPDIVQHQRGTKIAIRLSASDENGVLTGIAPLLFFPADARKLAYELLACVDET